MDTKHQSVYEKRLLTELHGKLSPRGVTAVLIVEDDGRYGLDVYDLRARPRRVYVHLAFLWIYWGDLADERVSIFRLEAAVDRLVSLAGTGWPDHEPGDLRFDLHGSMRAGKTR
ncbi:hypothetical protein J5X84_22195 [Streptosporangiaceae bacterium NEAU-GS5]|nr:hypothetical protein [Streptosporangiaceae bacterium NEAU-GS5]